MCGTNKDFIRIATMYKYGGYSNAQTAFDCWCDFIEKNQSMYGIFGESFLVFSPWTDSTTEQKVLELRNRHDYLIFQYRYKLTDVGAMNDLYIGQNNGSKIEVCDGIMIRKMYGKKEFS